MIKAYYAKVTEFESGWGCRPDGYLVTLDKDSGDKFSKKDNGHIWCMADCSEFSTKTGDWLLGLATYDQFIKDLNESEFKTLWIGKDIKKYLDI